MFFNLKNFSKIFCDGKPDYKNENIERNVLKECTK